MTSKTVPIYIRLLISFIVATLLDLPGNADVPTHIRFQHIGLENGLSHSTVFGITQDKRGCIWLATYDGVNRFDGYDFHVYRNQVNDSRSIADNTALCITNDVNDNIWVGTKEGLSLYNAVSDNFSNYFYRRGKVNTQVDAILPLPDGRLLLSTPHGITFFDPKHKKFQAANILKGVRSAAFSRQGNIVYIGAGHLYAWSLSTGRLQQLVSLPQNKGIPVLMADGQRIYIGTEGKGLFIHDLKTHQTEHYTAKDTPGLNSDYIRSLRTDLSHRIWIGTYNGLSIYENGHFLPYKSSFIEEGSLSQNSVRCIFRDTQGGMWLGTYYGGINYYHPLINRFRNIRHIPFVNSLSDNVVSCIVEDASHNLWIGTGNGSLNCYNLSTGRFSYPLSGTPYANLFKDIKTVYPHPHDNLVYIGAHTGGILVQDAQGNIKRTLRDVSPAVPFPVTTSTTIR